MRRGIFASLSSVVRWSTRLAVLATLVVASRGALAQAPIVLPYTMTTLVGPHAQYTGTFPQPCFTGSTAQAWSALGDGCPAAYVFVNTDPHDIRVDGLGNVYWLDDSVSSSIMVRKYNPRTGLVTVYDGSSTANGTCASAADKYGDGCPASDNIADQKTDYTYNGGTYPGFTQGMAARGISVAKNGDLFDCGYNANAVWKVAATTHIQSVAAGIPGTKGYSGDGGSASSALLNGLRGCGVDNNNNLFIADTGNNAIRMVNTSTGIITTIGGCGVATPGCTTAGYVDGSMANSRVSAPEDVQADGNGNIYEADFGNTVVRALYMGTGTLPGISNPVTGTWYTIVGNTAKTSTWTGVPTPATNISGQFRKLGIDKYNNLFVADSGQQVVWFIDHVTGYARIIAGSKGSTTPTSICAANTDAVGDGCPAVGGASIDYVSDGAAAVDSFENLYINDAEAASVASPTSRIREVVNDQNFGSVAAGSSLSQIIEVHLNPVGGSGGTLDTLSASSPSIVGSSDFTIVSTSAATTNADNTAEYLITVKFAPTHTGAETASLSIVTTSGQAASFPLTGTGKAPAVGIDPGYITRLPANGSVAFSAPSGIFTDAFGNAYIADKGANRVFYYNVNTNTTTVLAGTGVAGYSGDGALATAAKLNAPTAIAVDPANNVYVADTGNNVIRRIDATSGLISTYAGGASTLCSIASDTVGNGCLATQAILNTPSGIAFDASGNLYISDHTVISGTAIHTIRVVATNGFIFYFAGTSTACTTGNTDVFGDGCPGTQVTFNNPTGLAVDYNNNLYIADTGDNVVRSINLGTNPATLVSNLVTLVAGNGQAGASVANGSVATLSQLNAPTAVSLDAAGNIYIADTGNHGIRMVTAGTGLISTPAGILGSSGAGTVPGTSIQTQFASPTGIAATTSGALLVADTGNARIISDNRTQTSYAFGRTNVGASSPAVPFTEIGTGTTSTTLGSPLFAIGSTVGFPNYFTLNASSTSGCAAGTVLSTGVTCGLVGQFSPTASTFPTTVQATYAESSTTQSNTATPQVVLSGLALILTSTTSVIQQTTPAGSANPQYGGSFVVQATISPNTCNPSLTVCSTTGPSGTVTFIVDGTALAPVTLTAGSTVTSVSTASRSIPSLTVGSHTLVVSYSGDAYFAASTSSTLNVTVVTAPTTTVVTVLPTTSQQFTTTTFTATVASTTTGTPTGTVTFFSSGTPLGSSSLNSSGVATYIEQLILANNGTVSSNNTQVPGSYNITATYNGDANFVKSTSAAASLTVSADAAAIQLAGRSCNVPVAAFNVGGANAPTTPNIACTNDVSEPKTASFPMGVPYTVSENNAIATPLSGGKAGSPITAYELCPTASTSPLTCTTSATLDPTTFIPFVTFTEANTFTAGQQVSVTGFGVNTLTSTAFPNHIALNVVYTILSATSTSWTAALTPYAGVGQGSTIDNTLFVRPSNTLTGTLTFACSGLPANANCTFNPTTITLTPSTSVPSYIPVVVTYWTDLQPGSGGTSSMHRPGISSRSTSRIAFALIGAGLFGVFRLRRRNGNLRALALVALLLIATGSSMLFSGCANGPGLYHPNFTPAGVNSVTVTVTNGTVTQTIPTTFTIYGPGVTGAE